MRVIVVGGGFGGIKAALELANKPGIEVTLISERENFQYHAALYRSATGRSPLEVVLPLSDIFTDSWRNVEVVLDRIDKINPAKHCLTGQTGEIYEYDKVILALGSVVNYFGIKGVEGQTMLLDNISNAIALRYKLIELLKSDHREVKICIVGAGPAGVELAGELPSFAKLIAKKYSTPSPKRLKISLVEGAGRVLPALSSKASAKALDRLTKLGIDVMLDTRLESCEPGKVCLDSGDLDMDLLVWTAGYRANGFYTKHPDVFTMERGRVKVDQFLRAEGHEDIFVIGDNANTPYSGMAVTALHDAKSVAKNLARHRDKAPLKPYRPYHPTYVVPIGPKWALLQTGRKLTYGYKAWLFRRRADLAIFREFEPYKKALKTWRKANKLAKF